MSSHNSTGNNPGNNTGASLLFRARVQFGIRADGNGLTLAERRGHMVNDLYGRGSNRDFMCDTSPGRPVRTYHSAIDGSTYEETEILTLWYRFGQFGYGRVKVLLDALSENRSVEAPKNGVLGFHVEVTNRGSGFGLPWLRRLGMLCWAAGPILETLHHPSRRTAAMPPGAMPLLQHAAMGCVLLNMPNSPVPDELVLDGLQRLKGCKNSTQLAGLLARAVPEEVRLTNFSFEDSVGESVPRVTICQHASTFDSEEAIHWTAVCGALVQFARDKSTEEVMDLAAGLWTSPRDLRHEADVFAFLRAIGADEASDFYFASYLKIRNLSLS